MRVDRIRESEWPAYLADILATDEQADYSAELNEFHSVLEAVTLAAFDAQQSPEGEPWEEWMWRNYEFHAEPRALVRTQRLSNSFIRGNGSDNVDVIDGKTGMYGSNVEYAGLHQLGGTATRTEPLHMRGAESVRMKASVVNVKPRPMLGVTERMADRLADTVADGIIERMKG